MFVIAPHFVFSMLWHLGTWLTLAELPSEISQVLGTVKDSPVGVTLRRKPANPEPAPHLLTRLHRQATVRLPFTRAGHQSSPEAPAPAGPEPAHPASPQGRPSPTFPCPGRPDPPGRRPAWPCAAGCAPFDGPCEGNCLFSGHRLLICRLIFKHWYEAWNREGTRRSPGV